MVEGVLDIIISPGYILFLILSLKTISLKVYFFLSVSLSKNTIESGVKILNIYLIKFSIGFKDLYL